MEKIEISELERLANRSQLIAPINENQLKYKQGFFDGIREWGSSRGTEIIEKTYSTWESLKFLFENGIELLTLPQEKWDKKGVSKAHRVYLILANFLMQLQAL